MKRDVGHGPRLSHVKFNTKKITFLQTLRFPSKEKAEIGGAEKAQTAYGKKSYRKSASKELKYDVPSITEKRKKVHHL